MPTRKTKKATVFTPSKHSFWMTVIVLLLVINAVFIACLMFSMNNSGFIVTETFSQNP